MSQSIDRREFLKLAGLGGIVFASTLRSRIANAADAQAADDFYFVQLSDPHWGYSGVSNPEADVTLPKAVSTINGVAARPDFIVFTGDLTHNTDDAGIRRRRMGEFKKIVGDLKVKSLHLMPGEHDAAKDGGAAYRETFGATYHAFDHKGVIFPILVRAIGVPLHPLPARAQGEPHRRRPRTAHQRGEAWVPMIHPKDLEGDLEVRALQSHFGGRA